MKKILLCCIVAVIFSNCEVSVKKTVAQTQQEPVGLWENYSYKEVVREGMKFGVWYVNYGGMNGGGSSQTGYSTSVINLTKDSLEVALLREQLKRYSK